MPNNTIENIESIYTTTALLTVELITEETMMDVIRLLLSVQHMTLTSVLLSDAQKVALHALVISIFCLIPNVVHIACLLDYAETIIKVRRTEYPQLLPDMNEKYNSVFPAPSSEALLDLNQITEHLRNAGFDVARLLQAPGYVGGLTHRHSWVESGLRTSATDLNTYSTEVDSVSSSPGLQKKHPGEELTFDSMKKILMESSDVKKAAEDERRLRITETFRSSSFQELVNRTQFKSDLLQTKLSEILGKLKDGVTQMTVNNNCDEYQKSPAYELLFPELFVY